jgi:hypothetical protein
MVRSASPKARIVTAREGSRMTSTGAYPPGCTQADLDRWNDANLNEPPQTEVECIECKGEGEVFSGQMSHSVNSATIDPPEPIMEKCEACLGLGFLLVDAETIDPPWERDE